MTTLEAVLHREAVRAIIQLEQLLPTPDGQPLLAGAQHGHSPQQYFKLLVKALARYLEKLKLCDEQQLLRAAKPIGALLTALEKALNAYPLREVRTAIGTQHAEQVKTLLPEHGLYAAIATAATRMTEVLLQQQQPANLELQTHVATLTGELTWLYRGITHWLGVLQPPLWCGPFQTTLQPISNLAAAVLQAAAASAGTLRPSQAPTAAAGTKKGGKSRDAKPAADAQGKPVTPVTEGAFIGAAATADIVAAVLDQAAMDPYDFCQRLERSPQAKLFLQSPSTLKLLAVAAAVAAAKQHKQQRGVSPVPSVPGTSSSSSNSSSSSSSSSKASKQQQRQLIVPAYHQQLLEVMGLQHLDTQLVGPLINARWTPSVLQALMLYCMEASASMADMNSSGVAAAIWHTPGTPRRSAAETAHWYRQTVSPCFPSAVPLVLPLMLTVLELQVLEGHAVTRVIVTVQLMDHMLHMLAVKAKCGTFLEPDTAAVVLEALLLLLGPVVLHALNEKAPIEMQDSTLGTMYFYGCLLTRPFIQGEFQTTAQLFFKQPLVNAVAIEASLRAVACRLLPPTLKPLAALTPVMHGDAAQAAAGMQPHSYRVICILHDGMRGKVAAGGGSSSRATENQLTAKAAAAALAAQPKHMASALLSLLMTCCKTGSAAAADDDDAANATGPLGLGMLLRLVDQASMTAEVTMDLSKLYKQQPSGAGSSSACQSQDGNPGNIKYTESAPWLVLAARCLLLISRCYRQKNIDPADPPGLPKSAAERMIKALLGGSEVAGFRSSDTWKLKAIAGVVTWLGEQLTELLQQPAAAAPADAVATADQDYMNTLLQQQAAVVAALTELEAGVNKVVKSGMGSVDVEQLRVQWGSCWQLVEQFSTAVCCQLPVSSCCNNPGCLSLDKLSEQQLVGGKGCVCAGCGLARYCSRECQQQQWKQHKPVCRRVKAR